MANDEHLRIIKSGVKNWNGWRGYKTKSPKLPKLNLGIPDNEELSNIIVDLKGADLVNADLIGANFTDVILRDANLSRANLAGAYLVDADLTGANLAGANLVDADLTGANLTNAILKNANLTGAKLNETNLYQTDLTQADLSFTYFIQAILSLSNLSEACFYKSHLFFTHLTFNDLDGTDFTEANLGFTVFGHCDLTRCKGLKTVNVNGSCTIDFQTLNFSRNIPKSFLLKIGLPENYIDYLPDFYTDTLNFHSAFLSHSKENHEFARKLYEALIARGVSVFFDEKKLKPGDRMIKSIREGIHYYDKTIIVCSKASLSSEWVRHEMETTLEKEERLMEQRKEDINLLIPITIDDHIFQWEGHKTWHVDLKDRFIGDFRGWEDDARFEKALGELVAALNVDRIEVLPKSKLK